MKKPPCPLAPWPSASRTSHVSQVTVTWSSHFHSSRFSPAPFHFVIFLSDIFDSLSLCLSTALIARAHAAGINSESPHPPRPLTRDTKCKPRRKGALIASVTLFIARALSRVSSLVCLVTLVSTQCTLPPVSRDAHRGTSTHHKRQTSHTGHHASSCTALLVTRRESLPRMLPSPSDHSHAAYPNYGAPTHARDTSI